MVNGLKIEESYRIEYKRLFLKRSFNFSPIVIDLRDSFQNGSNDFLMKKLKIFGISADRIKSSYSFTFRKNDFIGLSHFNIYDCFFDDNKQIKAMEIVDLHVLRDNKGIGSKILSIIDEIAMDNKISLIFGELEKDSKYGSLEGRKKFFIKNGFILEKDNKANFSGWMIKKHY